MAVSSDRAVEGGEAASTSVEEAIEETRADRDAWRVENWPSVDLVNRPDRDAWNRDPDPLTGSVPTHSERHPRATIVFSDTEVSPAVSASTYESAEDVREAFMKGKSVPEVRQALADQASSPNEPTTELYRTDDDLRYERPELSDELDEDLEPDKGTRYDKTIEWARHRETIDDLQDSGKYNINLLEEVLDQPRPTGACTGTSEHPVVRDAPREAIQGGELVVALLAAWLVADHYARKGVARYNEWKQSRGDIDDAGH